MMTLNWYELDDRIRIYFKTEILSYLLWAGANKIGSINAFVNELGKDGTQFDSGGVCRAIHRETKGISVKKLKRICKFLDIPLDLISLHIGAIGGGLKSIRNVKFPLNFTSLEAGKLLGAITSDGGISRGMVVFYSNRDIELLALILGSVKVLFGDVNYRIVTDAKYNRFWVYFDSRIMGQILHRFGAPVGRKNSLNGGLPWVIKENLTPVQAAYLQQVFSDEGRVRQDGLVEYSRSINITLYLTNTLLLELENQQWETRFLPDGKTKTLYINYSKRTRVHLSKNLRNVIESNPPKLLREEADMLESKFGVKLILEPSAFRKTKNGFVVQWCSRTKTLQDSVRFFKKIGFGDTRKQAKFDIVMRNKGLV